MSLVQVIIDDSADKVITGVYEFDSNNGGVFVGSSGSSFPFSPTAKEWFWRTDERRLYRRDDTNSSWEAVESSVVSHHLSHEQGGSDEIVHDSLQGHGSNTHAQIDTHIASINNPHAVTEPQCWKYPASATDPTSPSPVDGDRYYNTAIEKWMFYSESRSKWLSIETATFQFGRNGNTAAGSYYKGINGMTLSNTRGWPAIHNGTVVAFGYTRSDNDYARFQIRAAGFTIAWEDSTDTEGVVSDLDADFDQDDILSVRNSGGGNTISNVQGWVVVRWRS